MPILSKKTMRKAAKQPFKPPARAKENIEKILGLESNSQKENNALNDSVSTNSSNISSRLNEPAIKKMYMDFTVNLSKQIICSTPLASQEVKEEDVKNMSFKDHMINVLNNTEEEPIDTISDEEEIKENVETEISLSQEMLNRKEVKDAYMEFMKNETDEEDLDFMKNFRKTKTIKRIFSSFEMNEKNQQKAKAENKPTKLDKARKGPIGRVKRIEQNQQADDNKLRKRKTLKDCIKNEESKGDKVVEKPKKQRKPRTQKEKMPKDDKVTDKKETKNLKRLETGKGKPSKKMTLVGNKRKDVDAQMDSGVCTGESTLSSGSSDLQAAANHRKLHNRALSTSIEERDESSGFKVTEQQALVCENSLYDVGVIVWAKIDGYPWWPAMVDEDPDFGTHIWMEEHFKEPTWYHVTFFDTKEVTRSWVRPNRIRAYNKPMVAPKSQKKYSARLKGSIKQAEDALNMSWSGRIAKYRFVVRYPNGVGDLAKEREEKQKLNEIKEKKREKLKEQYLLKLKSKVAKTYKTDVKEKKPKRILRLYSTETEEELQKFVDNMCIDMNEKQNLNELSFDMLEV